MADNLFPVKYQKTMLVILIAALGIFIFYMLRDLFSAILGSVLLYTLFKPFYSYLVTKKKINKGLSAGLVMLISFILIVVPFICACVMLIDKITEFRSHPAVITNLVAKINTEIGRHFNDPQFLQHRLADAQSWAFTLFSQVLNGAFRTVFTIFIMYFILFFMLTNNDEFEDTIATLLPLKQKGTKRLSDELRNISYSNVLGQGILAIIQGGCVIAGFAVFGIPDPFFWGVIGAFLSFIPVVGVPSMFAGAAIFLFADGDTLKGFGMLGWGVVVIALIENLLRIYIGRRIANVHPLISVIGVLVGIPVFGILGIVFGPLLLSYFILLISIYKEQTESEKRITHPSN